MVSNNSSLFMSMPNLIKNNMHFMDMKIYMLICFFISMLVGKENEQGSYKMEVVIRKKLKQLSLEMR
jgi:hypothetical protein